MYRRYCLNKELVKPSGFKIFIQILAKAELYRRYRIKQESLRSPVALGRFMQILVRQNYNSINTKTIIARKGIS
jgi:hypothetical protein